MRYHDMKQAVKLLDKEWNLGKREAGVTSDVCAWIYLMELLKETEQFVYYRENGKLLGFAGYSKYGSNKYQLKKKIYTFIKNQLYKSKDIKDLDALLEYENNYDYMTEDMKKDFDGEVSILIIDSKIRGKGIGKMLLSNLFELAKEDNVSNISICTDDSCNYNIYDSLGCERVYEGIVEYKEFGKVVPVSKERVYVYRKKLN